MKTIFSAFFKVLRTYRITSAINVVGLSAALIVLYIVLIQVHYDFTYDTCYDNVESIAQFNIYYGNEDDAYTNTNFQIPAAIAREFPEVEKYCIFTYEGEIEYDINKEGTASATYSLSYILTTPGFLEIFTPKIIMGDATDIFSSPGKAMISENMAKRMFGNQDPIGSVIRSHFGDEELTIQAIYKDFPENATMKNGIFTHLEEYDETESSFRAFFRIKPENLQTLKGKLNTASVLGEEWIEYLKEHPEERVEVRLTSLNELHINKRGKGGGKQINTTLTLLAIGVLTVFIAFVNFINLSLAMAPSRVKGMNIRKILGITKVRLGMSVAMESVLLAFIAILIALGGIYFIKGTTFASEVFAAELSLSSHIGLLIISSLIILLIAFGIGLYTMHYSTSFNEADALKGSFTLGIQGNKLRNVLIVLQFTTAITLICVSIFIKQQNDYMLHYDWGIEKENIIRLPLAPLGSGGGKLFGEELMRNPQIMDYTITRNLPGRVGMSWGLEFEGRQVNMTVWSVDERFFDFFGIEIIAGRKPEHADTIVSQMVFNEAFLKKHELDESIVGKDIDAFGPGRVEAIAKDVHFETLHNEIRPVAFAVLAKDQYFYSLLVKLSGGNIRESLDFVKTIWEKYTNEPFDVRFLDEEMDRLYRTETNMAKLIAIFGFIIVIIAVMGVYGLILFNTRYKMREIAIRKINGSTEIQIVQLLNRGVLIQIAVSLLIAIPVAYYAISKWLENFAFKSTIHWWIFLLAGALVLIITVATVSWQSWRAATANPVNALKNE